MNLGKCSKRFHFWEGLKNKKRNKTKQMMIGQIIIIKKGADLTKKGAELTKKGADLTTFGFKKGADLTKKRCRFDNEPFNIP